VQAEHAGIAGETDERGVVRGVGGIRHEGIRVGDFELATQRDAGDLPAGEFEQRVAAMAVAAAKPDEARNGRRGRAGDVEQRVIVSAVAADNVDAPRADKIERGRRDARRGREIAVADSDRAGIVQRAADRERAAAFAVAEVRKRVDIERAAVGEVAR